MADRAVGLAAAADAELAHAAARAWPRRADPDGFMTMPEVVQFIDDYAATIDAPVSRTRG